MTTKGFVDAILKQDEEVQAANLLAVTVNKEVPLELDLGRLCATDPNLIQITGRSAANGHAGNNEDEKMDTTSSPDAHEDDDKDPETSALDQYLDRTARDNVQLMLNALWDLETHKVDGMILARLPKPMTVLPRSKPPPKPRQPTKWESYAKAKGIAPRRKDKKIWDTTLNDWKPTHGFKRAAADRNENWMMEVPDNNHDPDADMFAKKLDDRKERVAKNEFQRLRNIAKEQKAMMGVPPAAPERDLTKEEASQAATYAHKATASVGKFDKSVRFEKPAKHIGKKRQFESNTQPIQVEKDKNLQIIDQIISKQPRVDIERAVDSLLSRKGNSVKLNTGNTNQANKRRSKAGGKSHGMPKQRGGRRGGPGGGAGAGGGQESGFGRPSGPPANRKGSANKRGGGSGGGGGRPFASKGSKFGSGGSGGKRGKAGGGGGGGGRGKK